MVDDSIEVFKVVNFFFFPSLNVCYVGTIQELTEKEGGNYIIQREGITEKYK